MEGLEPTRRREGGPATQRGHIPKANVPPPSRPETGSSEVMVGPVCQGEPSAGTPTKPVKREKGGIGVCRFQFFGEGATYPSPRLDPLQG